MTTHALLDIMANTVNQSANVKMEGRVIQLMAIVLVLMNGKARPATSVS